jgi:hypothetical protein
VTNTQGSNHSVPAQLKDWLKDVSASSGIGRQQPTDPRPPTPPPTPRGLLTTAEAAELLRVDPQTLRTWRVTGHHHDLPFVKMGSGGTGGRVHYRRSDLEAFITRHLFRNTAQADVIPAKAAVIPAKAGTSRCPSPARRETPTTRSFANDLPVAAAGRTRSDASIPPASPATNSATIRRPATASGVRMIGSRPTGVVSGLST